VDKVEIFGDSKLVVEQINRGNQCLGGTLNKYHDKCLNVLSKLGKVSLGHIPREANGRANKLVQQASGYDIQRGIFEVKQRPTLGDVLAIQSTPGESANES
jgi:hypothetical protein